MVASAIRSMGGVDLSPQIISKPSGEKTSEISKVKIPEAKPVSLFATPKLSISDFVSNAEEHLGKPYRLGGNGKNTMDCSQLVVESLKTAGVVSKSFDTTAAGFYSMSSKKKLDEVQKGDLLFWHNKGGYVTHVAIALSAPDQKGYVEIIDASASKKSVAKRKFHTSLAGLSAGYLPFVGTPVSDPLPVYAQAAPKTTPSASKPLATRTASVVAVSAPKAAPTPKAETSPVRLVQADILDFPAPAFETLRGSSVHSTESFRSENVRPAVFVPKDVIHPVVATHSTPLPENTARNIESRVSAKVVDLTSRIADAKTAESVRESLSKRSIVEQIDYYRAQAEASNDPSFSVTASKLELVKLHGERKLVSENIARYKEQATKSVPGAFETVVKLNRVASILDQKIGTLTLALNEDSSQIRRAA